MDKTRMRKIPVPLLIAGTLIAGALFVWSGRAGHEDLSSKISPAGLSKAKISINKGVFEVEEALTRSEQEQGLSGRGALKPDTGMWFDFGSENLWGIWMKDMKFSIDIIWLDANMQIVSFEKNVSPETYPKSFTPTARAAYVLEVPAGTVDKYSLKVGDRAKIE